MPVALPAPALDVAPPMEIAAPLLDVAPPLPAALAPAALEAPALLLLLLFELGADSV
jgi:hypothetical protein